MAREDALKVSVRPVGESESKAIHVLTSLERERITELLRRDEFFWLDLTAPSTADFELLGELLQLRKEALDDVRNFNEDRAHLHEFHRDSVVLNYFAAGYPADGDNTDLSLFEIHLIVSGSYLVTLRHGRCAELDRVRRQLEAGSHESEELIFYRVLDSLTDSYFPVLSKIAKRIDRLEDDVTTDASEEHLKRIQEIKRDLVRLRGIVSSQRDLFSRITDEIDRMPGLEQADRDAYLRSTQDHLIWFSELIEGQRELLSSVRDMHMSSMSNRLNQIMMRLTIVATIFLPLGFLTGFFGQNFGWLNDQMDSFAVFVGLGLGLLASSVVVLWMWFRRSDML